MQRLGAVFNSKSKTFFAFCFCFILGVGVFSIMGTANPPAVPLGKGDGPIIIYLLSFIILSFAIFFWSNKRLRILLFCLLFFLIGALRFLASIPALSPDHISYYREKNIDFEGIVVKEPDAGISDTRYVAEVLSCDSEECPKEIRGRILAVLPPYAPYGFGDVLKIRCYLRDPGGFSSGEFDYEKYLAKDDIWAICGNPEILSVKSYAKAPLGKFLKLKISVFNRLFYLKSKIQEKINNLWPEPESSFMAGLLYGSKSGLPPELLENFNRTGITHVIAVSGYNVSIFAVYLMSTLVYLFLPRSRAFWLATLLIIIFIFFTGASASVVRAGIMGITALVACQVGRVTRPHNILVFAAGLMVLTNPYVLIWDAGFQLSFLAMLGLVYLSPILQDLPLAPALKSGGMALPLFLRRGWGEVISPIFISTLSAIIATLPFMLFQFGRLSIVAPLVNMLILGIIPLLMFFGFFSIILGFLFYPLGQIIAWITAVGLKYVIIISGFFGTQSWSAINWQIPFWLMIGMYGVLIIVIAKRLRSESGR